MTTDITSADTRWPFPAVAAPGGNGNGDDPSATEQDDPTPDVVIILRTLRAPDGKARSLEVTAATDARILCRANPAHLVAWYVENNLDKIAANARDFWDAQPPEAGEGTGQEP